MPTEEKKRPEKNPSKKLLSEMPRDEIKKLSRDEHEQLLTEQMLHNLRTHIPDGMEPASPPEKPDPSQEDGQALYEESCARCKQRIGPAEPHAYLECSLHSFVEEQGEVSEGTHAVGDKQEGSCCEFATAQQKAIEVTHAVGFGPLCRTCGEQLQLTSQTAREATKLLRSAQAVPALAQALPSLPPLPPLVLASPYEAGVGDVDRCWQCWLPLKKYPNWLDVSLLYERTQWNATKQHMEAEVLDCYVTISLCQECWQQVPLAPLSSDVSLAAHWVAACVQLLGQHE
ncbi:MAG: hypothetical protein AB7G75_24655 [Candidatus Binatia bacterium]